MGRKKQKLGKGAYSVSDFLYQYSVHNQRKNQVINLGGFGFYYRDSHDGHNQLDNGLRA